LSFIIVFCLFYRSLAEINRLWNEDLNPSESVKQTVQHGASSSDHREELAKVSGIVRWVLSVYRTVHWYLSFKSFVLNVLNVKKIVLLVTVGLEIFFFICIPGI
jgi:hypothetical protein